MSEQFDEAWEFYSPDPEVEELFAERQDRDSRIATTDRKKFLFRFEGDGDMTNGRFFDGVSFGRVKAESFFCWGAQSPYRDSSLVKLFEETVLSVDAERRSKWLADGVVRAWPKVADRSREILVAMITTEHPVRRARTGKSPGPIRVVMDRFDASWSTVWRHCLRARIRLMSELIEPALLPKCQCGCGRPAPIAYIDNRKYGHNRLEPCRFITGHNSNGPPQQRMPPARSKIRLSADAAGTAIEVIERLVPYVDEETRTRYEKALEEIRRAAQASAPKRFVFP